MLKQKLIQEVLIEAIYSIFSKLLSHTGKRRQKGCAALPPGHLQQQHKLHSQEKDFPLMHCTLKKFSWGLLLSDFAVVVWNDKSRFLCSHSTTKSHLRMTGRLWGHPSAARSQLITAGFVLIKWMQYPVLPNNINWVMRRLLCLQMNSINAIKWTSGCGELLPSVCL